MKVFASNQKRLGLLFLAAGALVLGVEFGGAQTSAGSGVPATRPTPDTLATAVPASALSAADRAVHRANVTYIDGELEIVASNSSLNQILRQISRQTGLVVTGGVQEERVYGKYGPGMLGDVLSELLDGTASNILYKAGEAGTPAELSVTPRGGGATPPSPGIFTVDDEAPVQAQAAPPPTATATPQAAQPTPTTTTNNTLTVDAPTVSYSTEPGTTPGPNTQATGTSSPADPSQSPNGVKTPQQIFEQLQALRQQQQKQPAPQ